MIMEGMTGSVQGKVQGVIIPPPEIRAVVDKTAQFVARNGKSFEQRILLSNEGKTSKFNFMQSFDPYHAYYEFKIREFEEADAKASDSSASNSNLVVDENVNVSNRSSNINENPQVQVSTQSENKINITVTNTNAVSTTSAKASIANPIALLTKNKPYSPSPYEFSITHPPNIPPVDADIIKLTAQYTAVNGREFLTGLALREQKNPQFDFLRPTHLLFSYFTSLVDSYAKVISPTADQIGKIISLCDWKKALEVSVNRWEWNRQASEIKRRESEQKDEERLALQLIDWSEFIIVETIDFPQDELFEVAAIPNNTNTNNNNNTSTTNTTNTTNTTPVNKLQPQPHLSAPAPPLIVSNGLPPPPPPPLPLPSSSVSAVPISDELDSEIKVVTNYQPRMASSTIEGSSNQLKVKDPITGKEVFMSDIDQHMKVIIIT